MFINVLCGMLLCALMTNKDAQNHTMIISNYHQYLQSLFITAGIWLKLKDDILNSLLPISNVTLKEFLYNQQFYKMDKQ